MDKLQGRLIDKIKSSGVREFTIMEVCGTHTDSIGRFGLRRLLYPEVKLISGPGCPVCVTDENYIDAALELLKNQGVILTTFGDLMRVNGSRENLINAREKGGGVTVVYSPLDALKIAEENKTQEVVFLAVGFETTAPLIALALKRAKEKEINNFSIFTSLKIMRPVLEKILGDKNSKVQGIICPGHVAVIMGSRYFKFISDNYSVPAVVTGFESADIIGSVYLLMKHRGEKYFENLYKTCVKTHGNKSAQRIMKEVFLLGNCAWRGIGEIKESGLFLREEYREFDAAYKFHLSIKKKAKNGCVCSEIILGQKSPGDCKFFGRECTPHSPVGPCMVSREGSCAIYYKYGGVNNG